MMTLQSLRHLFLAVLLVAGLAGAEGAAQETNEEEKEDTHYSLSRLGLAVEDLQGRVGRS